MLHQRAASGALGAGRRAPRPSPRALSAPRSLSAPRAPKHHASVIARAEPPASGGGNGAPSPEEQRASNGMGNLFLKENAGENLDSRIASGEFSDSGSTKEQMTRPLRKALAQDRDFGIGECALVASGAPPPH
jgi:hypothetical protein